MIEIDRTPAGKSYVALADGINKADAYAHVTVGQRELFKIGKISGGFEYRTSVKMQRHAIQKLNRAADKAANRKANLAAARRRARPDRCIDSTGVYSNAVTDGTKVRYKIFHNVFPL
jgi:hypothetical protein